jgi:hypothetical protein
MATGSVKFFETEEEWGAISSAELPPGPADRVSSSYSTQLAYDWAPCDAASSIGMLQRLKHPGSHHSAAATSR